MKVRNGFVSNSSTSSFIIRGFIIDEKNRDEVIKKMNLTDEQKEEFEDDENEFWWEWFGSNDIDITANDFSDEHEYFVGPNCSIDYCEDLTDEIMAMINDDAGQLKKLQELFGWDPKDAKIWGLKAEC